MNDSADTVSEATVNLPVLFDETQQLPKRIYADLVRLDDPEWHDTGAGEGWSLLNPQVYRALERVLDGVRRHRPPEETVRRAAVILLSDPLGATPYRCPTCQRHYTASPVPADWAIAGRDDLPCRVCTLATPATKTIKVTPAQVRRTRRAPRTRQQPKAAS